MMVLWGKFKIKFQIKILSLGTRLFWNPKTADIAKARAVVAKHE
jgi:hypothetical protein